VSFLRADVTDLSAVPDASFDMVYTGGHVSVWVSDIRRYYSEAMRILRAGGSFIVNEYHPIRRMWLESDGTAPRHSYFNRGPYEYRTKSGLSQFEFHWTSADHIQALLDAGCALVTVDEFGEGKDEVDFESGVPEALPLHLLIVGRKTRVDGSSTKPDKEA
jgi:ubiquinone/menaquinone biosynthesis C-methylase UbiE